MGCRPDRTPARVSSLAAQVGSNDTKVNPCPESEFPARGSNDHRESEPKYSPFGASPSHQGAGVVIDLPDHLVELIDVKGAMWVQAPDLVD